jgi:hypothetical protein
LKVAGTARGAVPQRLHVANFTNNIVSRRNVMFRTGICIATVLIMAGTLVTASAQTAAPAPTTSRLKLTKERLNEMRLKWNANKGKLAACRKEVKSKGLIGDDRWFYIEDCMAKS